MCVEGNVNCNQCYESVCSLGTTSYTVLCTQNWGGRIAANGVCGLDDAQN
jgi:hypothetical protein